MIKDKFISTVYRAVAALMVLLFIGHWQSAFAEPSSGPQELVQNTTGRLLTAIRTEQEVIRQNPERLYELIEDIVIPVLDRERISRWVLGRHWHEATAEQRSRFIKEFQTMLIRTYATPLLDYTDVEVNYLSLSDSGNTDVVVRTQIQPSGGEPLPVYYNLHSRDGNWKVYDVTIGGVSAVITLRTTFSSQIRKVGLEEFIRQLSEKNRRRQTIIDITPDFKLENTGH